MKKTKDEMMFDDGDMVDYLEDPQDFEFKRVEDKNEEEKKKKKKESSNSKKRG